MQDIFTQGRDPTAEERNAIANCHARYCRGVDRSDKELIASAYWPDAIDHHGIFDGNGHEFAEFIPDFLEEAYTGTLHQLGQSLIRVNGDHAITETYFTSFHGSTNGGARKIERVTGRYADHMENRGGVWKIKERTVIIDFIVDQPNPPHPIDDAGMLRGTRGHSDPSQALAGTAFAKAFA